MALRDRWRSRACISAGEHVAAGTDAIGRDVALSPRPAARIRVRRRKYRLDFGWPGRRVLVRFLESEIAGRIRDHRADDRAEHDPAARRLCAVLARSTYSCTRMGTCTDHYAYD